MTVREQRRVLPVPVIGRPQAATAIYSIAANGPTLLHGETCMQGCNVSTMGLE